MPAQLHALLDRQYGGGVSVDRPRYVHLGRIIEAYVRKLDAAIELFLGVLGANLVEQIAVDPGPQDPRRLEVETAMYGIDATLIRVLVSADA